MTGLVSLSLLGALILFLGVRLLVQAQRRKEMPSVTLDDYAKAREVIESLVIETAAIERILSAEDAEFIARSARPDVKCLFLNERKKLALPWFQDTRKQIARLMDIHLRLAAYTNDPNPAFELKLTAKYLTFLVVSSGALVLLWLLGPFKATRVLSYTARAAGNFCSIFSLRLDRVNPLRLGSGSEFLVH